MVDLEDEDEEERLEMVPVGRIEQVARKEYLEEKRRRDSSNGMLGWSSNQSDSRERHRPGYGRGNGARGYPNQAFDSDEGAMSARWQHDKYQAEEELTERSASGVWNNQRGGDSSRSRPFKNAGRGRGNSGGFSSGFQQN